jgi:hypothetical protein
MNSALDPQWMDRLGILRASREPWVGKYLMRTDPFPGKTLGLRWLPRSVKGATVLADHSGGATTVAAVSLSEDDRTRASSAG